MPVYLLEGEIIHKCNSNREVAKRLAPHLFGGTLRVHGFGKWNRDSFGNWVMERFNITDFTPLDDSNLSVAVAKMRSITTDLHSSDDPLKELGRLSAWNWRDKLNGTDEDVEKYGKALGIEVKRVDSLPLPPPQQLKLRESETEGE